MASTINNNPGASACGTSNRQIQRHEWQYTRPPLPYQRVNPPTPTHTFSRMTAQALLLTKIQKLLYGERGRRKPGVILDFGVGVFQQTREDPHFEKKKWKRKEKKKKFNGDARVLNVRMGFNKNTSVSFPVMLTLATLTVLLSRRRPHFFQPAGLRWTRSELVNKCP